MLPLYGLPGPVRCRLASLSLNDTYQVDAADGTRFLRVYRHASRLREEIEAELALLDDLRAAGLPASSVVARADGGRITALNAAEGTRYAALFTAASGDDAGDITLVQSWAYGRLAARLHGAFDACELVGPRPDIDTHQLIDEPLAAIEARFGEHEEVVFLRGVVERVRAAFEQLPRESPDFGLCHGDLHPGNARFGADGEPALFDFDLCGHGWRGYDLTVFRWNSYLERRTARWRESRWRAFLRGYREVRPLPSDLPATMPFFLAARQIWLLGLDCAGKTDQLPQQVDERALRMMVGFVRQWAAEYPALRSHLAI